MFFLFWLCCCRSFSFGAKFLGKIENTQYQNQSERGAGEEREGRSDLFENMICVYFLVVHSWASGPSRIGVSSRRKVKSKTQHEKKSDRFWPRLGVHLLTRRHDWRKEAKYTPFGIEIEIYLEELAGYAESYRSLPSFSLFHFSLFSSAERTNDLFIIGGHNSTVHTRPLGGK